MLKSLYSGISGMKGFQTKLDVIGNNIANVNTIGFKKGRVEFQDILNQNLSVPTAPTAILGGINPKQIGLGSRVSSIDTIHTPGSPMTTNVGTDMAIDGDAYFVVSPQVGDPNTMAYYLSKAGNFNRDSNGDLVTSNGFYVNGVVTDASGQNPQYVKINITEDQGEAPKADGTQPKFVSYSIDINGNINVVREDGQSGLLAMNSAGQYYLSSNANSNENISIGTSVVKNPGGLQKVGNTMFKYEETGNAGVSKPNRIITNHGGQINAGMLEMSNVDLTEEFTEMIVAQRGFQANARTITTSDSLLEEIVNLKR